MPTKNCSLGPISTVLLKQCLPGLVPTIACIVNKSLSTGTVPLIFKQAIVKPLLKRPGLDPNILKHYRPVSNLPFLSKVLERVVLGQLQEHLSCNQLPDVNQSACRKGHSTETAVLGVIGELLISMYL